jgi:DNA-binding transcriptional LysR family regulator
LRVKDRKCPSASIPIRYFDAVRRAQSIREAARQLNVASSAVNRQIIKLEEEIGEPLFHRLPSGLVLTPVGEALARHVITVFQDLERTGAEIDDMHGARVGHITVAVVESVASSILPKVIDLSRARAPRVTFTVSVMGSFDIPAAIVSGEADVGVAFALRKSTELQQVFLSQFRLGAIVRPPWCSFRSMPRGRCGATSASIRGPGACSRPRPTTSCRSSRRKSADASRPRAKATADQLTLMGSMAPLPFRQRVVRHLLLFRRTAL